MKPTLFAIAITTLASAALSAAPGDPPTAEGSSPPELPAVTEIDPTNAELAKIPAWVSAQNAHRDGLADVAAARFAEVAGFEGISTDAGRRVRHLLVESLIRSRQYEAALAAVVGDELPVWRGLALAGLGRQAESQPLLSACVDDPDHPMHEFALLTLVAGLRQLGDLDRAVELLQTGVKGSPRIPLILAELHLEQKNDAAALAVLKTITDRSPPIDLARDLLRAEALLGRGTPQEAQSVLGEILASPPESIPKGIHHRAALLMADAVIASGESAKAIGLLKGIIDSAPEGLDVLADFDRLYKIGAFATTEGAEMLGLWTKSQKPAVARSARFYRGLIDGRGEKRIAAIEDLEALAARGGAVAVRAKLLLSELWIENDDKEKALAALAALGQSTGDPAVAARIAFVEAKALHKEGEFKKAADRFASIAEKGGAPGVGSFNAALDSLMAGDEASFRARLALLPEVSGQQSRGELEAERALYMAANKDPAARDALAEFLRIHPDHPRAVDAHLALAGLHVLDWPPKAKSAREALAAARELDLDSAHAERADYLAFWIEEGSGEDDMAVELAEKFIGKWPKSPLAPGVRMRQAEVHFRSGDYLDALRRFEQLAADYPDSELADPALFFAGRAAMLTLTEDGAERALTLWQKLAKSDSPLAPLARRHQAQLKLRQGDQVEALVLIDAILAEDPGEPLRSSVLLLKGEALYTLGARMPERLVDAIAVFESALSNTAITTAARNEILFRKGKAHESLKQMTEALDAYHRVVTGPRAPLSEGETPEFRWYYRAGFESIRILEARKTPEAISAAIGIADMLASFPGPRTAEARKAAEQLRLENFIWQEK